MSHNIPDAVACLLVINSSKYLYTFVKQGCDLHITFCQVC